MRRRCLFLCYELLKLHSPGMCDSQGMIEFGFSSKSNNNTVHYSILHITQGFQRDFVHVLRDTEASVVQNT